MRKLTDVHAEASKYFIAGASAGQRYNAPLGQPLYISRADGSRFWDTEGNEFIDFHTGAGAALFGHNNPRIREAIDLAMELGFFMNFDTEYHTQLAKLLQQFFPSCERVRLLNTGSEATQAAIRLARAYSGRDKVLRFEGHFHGMHESIWFNHNMVSRVDSQGEVETNPDSAGFPVNAKTGVVNVVFNDVEAIEHALAKYKGEIACVILEPISYNCGCLEARGEYLRAVREICTREDIVLIFDEVISGLRMRPGSAQKYYGILPDLTVMAKAIGGGLSIAAFGGKKQIMERLNPVGDTAVSGTYSGALMPVLASVACLTMASEEGFYDRIEDIGSKLFAGIEDLLSKHKIVGHVRGQGARFGIYFGVENPEDDFDFRKIAAIHDKKTYRNFVTECVKNGFGSTIRQVPFHLPITALLPRTHNGTSMKR